MIKFCNECDISSSESAGKYIKNIWYCESHISEGEKPKHVPGYVVDSFFKELLEEMDNDTKTSN